MDDPLENLQLKSFGPTADGGVNLAVVADETIDEGLAIVFAGMASMLEAKSAPNYIEFDMHRVGQRSVSVCVRWLDRPTPHQLRCAAETTSIELRNANEHLSTAINRVRDLHAAAPDEAGYLRCRSCRQFFPCETVRALDQIN